MLYAIYSYIFAIFLFSKPICGQSPLNSNIGYANFQRNLPRQSLRQHEELLMLANKVVDGENAQKLLSKPDSSFGSSNTPTRKSPKKILDGNADPENVNRVQEMTALRWPMGVVPYFVDTNSYDTTTRKRILKAMAAIEAVSCIIFRELERIPDSDAGSWLHFTNPQQERECRHQFNVVEGGSEVVLGFDCLRPEEILHSLLHAIGFRDEVTHPQRDQYIRVMWDNIQPKYRDLFRVQYEDAAYKLVEYDPMSIMHFHDRAFTDNGAATIVSIIPGLQLSSNTALSQLDVMRLKLAFRHECTKRNIGDLLDTCKNSLVQNKTHDQAPNSSEKDEHQEKEENPDDANASGGDYKSEEEKHSNGDEKHDRDKSDDENDTNESHSEEKNEENEVPGETIGAKGKQKLPRKIPLNRHKGSRFESMYFKSRG